MITQIFNYFAVLFIPLFLNPSIDNHSFLNGHWINESNKETELHSVTFIGEDIARFTFDKGDNNTMAIDKKYEVTGYDKAFKVIFLNVYTKNLFTDDKEQESPVAIQILGNDILKIKTGNYNIKLKRKPQKLF